MDRLITKRLLLDGKISSKLRDSIIVTLANGAQGMFRWVELSLEALKRIKFIKDFRDALGRLPSELSSLYEIIHTQINQTETYGRDVATGTLKWLLCAQRLLSVDELIAAISLLYEDDTEPSSDPDDNEMRSEQVPSPEDDIIRLCRNLVIIDPEQKVFRFAHQSVREYLLSRPEYTIVEQHALATERCLDVYLAESWPGSITPKMVQQNHALKPYAKVYWPAHYKYVEDYESHELERKVSRFTRQGSKTSPSYVQWASDINQQYGGRSRFGLHKSARVDDDDRLRSRLLFASSRPHSHLIAACAFGFLSFMKDCELSSMYWNQLLLLNDENFTMLLIAAEEGHHQVVQMLLGKGANINAQGGIYGSALQAASIKGHSQVVQILLNNGANTNAQGGLYGDALHLASLRGHNQVVQMLLKNGADINAQGEAHGTALQAASYEGYTQVVQMLLENGADINAQGGGYGSALQAASVKGHHQLVQMLVENGASINSPGGDYGSALQAAASGGHEQVVRLLLENQADINAQGGNYGSALQAASYEGHHPVVRILLDNKANIDQRDTYGRTALHFASAGGHKAIVKLFFGLASDLSITDMQRRNCLHHAASNGSAELVTWLLQQGFDPNLPDRDGWTSLHWAARNGSIETIRILEDAGGASSIEAIKGWTPRSVAVFHHNEHLLIPAANITSGSPQFETALIPTFSSPVFEMDSTSDGNKISPGAYHGELLCELCFLVSQKPVVLKVLSADSSKGNIWPKISMYKL